MRQLKPIFDVDRLDWEIELVMEIEELLEVTTSDAQGILEATNTDLDKYYREGFSPKETAELFK